MTTILKRLVVLMMFVMFIISIAQIAWAEENKEKASTGASTDSSVDVSKDGSKIVKAAVKVEAKTSIKAEHDTVKEIQMKKVDGLKGIKESNMTTEVKKEALTDLKAETKGAMKESKDKIKMIKEERKEKLSEIRDERQKEREVYTKVKDEHKALREENAAKVEELKKLRTEAKNCKETDADCKAKKDEIKTGVRMHLVNTVGLIDSSVARLRARVEVSATLSAEEKTKMLAEMDALQTKLGVQREAVKSLEAKDGVTNEELRAAVKDLKKTWEEVQKAQRRIIAGLINTENSFATDRHKEFGVSMQAKIDLLRTKGADVAGLVALQNEFTVAQTKLEADRIAALSAWKDAENKPDAQEAWRKAQAVVKEDLQQSKEILRRFSALHKELVQKLAASKKEADVPTKASTSTNLTEQAAVVAATSTAADTTAASTPVNAPITAEATSSSSTAVSSS